MWITSKSLTVNLVVDHNESLMFFREYIEVLFLQKFVNPLRIYSSTIVKSLQSFQYVSAELVKTLSHDSNNLWSGNSF